MEVLMSFSEKKIQEVWEKGTKVPKNDPSKWRKDQCGGKRPASPMVRGIKGIFFKGEMATKRMPSDDDNRLTAFPLHNNEPELIDYFASPLGISESTCMPSEPHGEGDIAVELWKKLEPGEK